MNARKHNRKPEPTAAEAYASRRNEIARLMGHTVCVLVGQHIKVSRPRDVPGAQLGLAADHPAAHPEPARPLRYSGRPRAVHNSRDW